MLKYRQSDWEIVQSINVLVKSSHANILKIRTRVSREFYDVNTHEAV